MAMKQAAVVVGASVIAFVAGRSLTVSSGAAAAQPPKDTKPAVQPPKPDKPGAPGQPGDPMAEWMAKMQPGDHHKHLNVMLGTWEGSIKFWMAPDAEAGESTGSVHREWDMDERFLIEHVEGSTEGFPPFKGLGIVGYNTVENRYESVWIENMATYISFMTGSYDANKKTFTFTGDMLDPMTGKRQKQRHIVDVSDPNKQTMVGYSTSEGKEFKCFEGSFTKKK